MVPGMVITGFLLAVYALFTLCFATWINLNSNQRSGERMEMALPIINHGYAKTLGNV